MDLNDKNEVENYVTLILQNRRFEIDKQALIKKSQYFAVLLSSNYIDRYKREHIINYDIPLELFQDLIKWIHGEDIENIIDGKKEINNVLILLEMSILFIVDDLTDDIIEKIEQYYQLPKYIIQIWLFAQELGLNVLEDVCLATCLDRFFEIPQKCIMQLSIENFMRLIDNTNLRCEEKYFETIVLKYRILNPQLIKKYKGHLNKPKLSCGIVSSNGFDNNIYLHCWDNDFNSHTLFELDKFSLPKELVNLSNGPENKNLEGMQVVGRGCYLYFVGGEFGIGSERYNTKIWRYSLLTKKWFCYATMPRSRRHMIAIFIENKLLLVGGIGKLQQKLNTMDIYNIHTGKWSRGAKMPITFIGISEHYVFRKTLVVYNYMLPRNMCIYYPNLNTWSVFSVMLDNDFINAPILPLENFLCYIDDTNPNHLTFNILHKMENNTNIKNLIDVSNFITNTNDALLFVNIKLCTWRVFNLILCLKYCFQPNLFKYQYFCWPILEKNKFRLFFSMPHRFFNLIDPANLHTQKHINLLVIVYKELQQKKRNHKRIKRIVNVHC